MYELSIDQTCAALLFFTIGCVGYLIGTIVNIANI